MHYRINLIFLNVGIIKIKFYERWNTETQRDIVMDKFIIVVFKNFQLANFRKKMEYFNNVALKQALYTHVQNLSYNLFYRFLLFCATLHLLNIRI